MGRFSYFIGNDIEIEIYALDFFDLVQVLSDCFRKLILGDDEKLFDENLISNIIELDVSDYFFPVDYVNELIYLFDTQSFLPTAVKLHNSIGSKIEIFGFNVLSRNIVKRLLKAATYHQYQFTKAENGNFYVKMIIDI
ncbi:MAG: archease [Elusimicrobiales bacterium]|nr:archease [Elusimicrobiales bacterium]